MCPGLSQVTKMSMTLERVSLTQKIKVYELLPPGRAADIPGGLPPLPHRWSLVSEAFSVAIAHD